MSKAARIKRERKEGRDLRHTVVSKIKNRFEMNNPANSEKKKRLDREKARSERTNTIDHLHYITPTRGITTSPTSREEDDNAA